MVQHKVEKIISGDFGPKAKSLLDRFGIQMLILDQKNLTVGEILEKIKQKHFVR